MAAILVGFSFVVSLLLNQVLNMNLDRFLHQQADNFKATISINNNSFSFHDLHADFEHLGEEEEEIPFFLQMMDKHGKTLLVSGNTSSTRLYHGGALPDSSTYETISFFDKPSRQLTSPIMVQGQRLGWVIVTLPFDYLDSFTQFKNKILVLTTLGGIFVLTLLSILFVKLALKPVTTMAKTADQLAEDSSLGQLPDISRGDELADLTDTLNKLLRKAGESMETLELFAANASHELKTPLALMRAELSHIQTKQGPDLQISVDLLSVEVDRMQTMIDNLLLLSHSKNPYEVNLQEIWLNDFISDEAGRLQLGFLRKIMNFDFAGVASIKIRTDAYLLQLVVDNVLRNAIFHTPEDTTITISSNFCDNCVCISVEDMGPGIPQEKIKDIFQPFVQGAASTGQIMKGSGLGLSIAKWAMDLLGGGIAVENITPNGLRVTLSVPQNELISLSLLKNS